MPSRRQLAAIMFTDIVGYTAMMQHDEQKAVSTVNHHQELLKACSSQHEGKVLNDYGDGSLSIFNSAVEALQCAKELQEQFRQTPKVPLRIGIHIGEVRFEEGKIFGDGVNIASRIESLGQEGTVLFSKHVAEKIRNLPEFKVTSLGEFEFKNVDHPIEVFALANEGFPVPKRETMEGKLKYAPKKSKAGLVARWSLASVFIVMLVLAFWMYKTGSLVAGSEVSEGNMSIAVLPFRNLSGDKTQDYFSDGITEDIITEVAKIRGFKKVIPGTTVEVYKKTDKSIPEIAKELGVSLILEGTARFIEDQIRITAKLIDAAGGDHLWSEDYDTLISRKQIMGMQGELAKTIAQSLQISLSPKEEVELEHQKTTNAEAYDLFLRARAEHRGFTVESTYKSNDLLEEAIKLDPNFHEAYTLMAWNYNSLGWSDMGALRPREAGRLGLQAIEKAIKIEPKYSDAYLVKGALQFFLQWDLEEAEKTFKKAMKVKSWWNMTTPYCFCAYEHLLIAERKFEEAEALLARVYEIDDAYFYYYFDQAKIHFSNGRLEEAVKAIDKQYTFDGIFYINQFGGRIYTAAGQYEKAISRIEEEMTNTGRRPAFSVAVLADAYRQFGNERKYQILVKELEDRFSENDFDTGFALGLLAASNKSYEKALEYLEVGFQNHDWHMFLVNTDPYFEPMRKDPRFRDLLDRIGFPNDWK